MFGSRFIHYLTKDYRSLPTVQQASGDWDLSIVQTEFELVDLIQARPVAQQLLMTAMPWEESVELSGRLLERGIFVSTLARLAPHELPLYPPTLGFCGGRAISETIEGEALAWQIELSLQLDAVMVHQRARCMEFRGRLETLSQRELEVLDCIATGRSSKQMASTLDIGSQTVLKHRASLLRKMEARSDVELALQVKECRDNPCLHCCDACRRKTRPAAETEGLRGPHREISLSDRTLTLR
jgi:DNA-binding CsgD family transcriptional regulator